jgi:hypothetical protein
MEFKHLPLLNKLPTTLQDKMVEELKQLSDRKKKNIKKHDMIEPKCNCEFYLKYLLPCQHILQCYEEGDIQLNVINKMKNDIAAMGFKFYLFKLSDLSNIVQSHFPTEEEKIIVGFHSNLEQLKASIHSCLLLSTWSIMHLPRK